MLGRWLDVEGVEGTDAATVFGGSGGLELGAALP